MKIANILYEDELVNHKQVEFINYHKISEFSSTIFQGVDHELPTLIVGWKFLQSVIPDNDVNILKHKIVENKLYWEFSFNENKSSHVTGIQSFVEYAPKFYFNPRYQYINLDPVFYQIADNKDLFDILPKDVTKTYIYDNRMLYTLKDDKIYGLDLEMYKFFKFNIDDIKARLKEKSFAYFDDMTGDIYQKYYKIFPEFTYLKRYLVVIVSN